MSNLIYKKMSEVMKEVGFIAKAQTNSAQGFKFRGIDQFVNALYPALTKHGVFMTPRATQFTQEVRDVVRANGKAAVDKHVAIMMEYDFFAEDGSKVTVGPIPAEGLDSGDKATNKALSAALKYALIQTFSIPTVDMAEADLDSPELGSKAKPEPSWKKETPTVAAKTPIVGPNSAQASPSLVANVNAEFDAIKKPEATTLEPLKKSSFRKKTTTPVATTETTGSSDWS
jgi:hypothetical protein